MGSDLVAAARAGRPREPRETVCLEDTLMPGPGSFWIGDEERQEVLEVLASGHLSRYGDLDNPKFTHKVYTFEQELARYCGVRHALAISSGTCAMKPHRQCPFTFGL